MPLLAEAAARAGIDATGLEGLAALIEGRVEPDRWARTLTAPPPRRRGAKAA